MAAFSYQRRIRPPTHRSIGGSLFLAAKRLYFDSNTHNCKNTAEEEEFRASGVALVCFLSPRRLSYSSAFGGDDCPRRLKNGLEDCDEGGIFDCCLLPRTDRRRFRRPVYNQWRHSLCPDAPQFDRATVASPKRATVPFRLCSCAIADEWPCALLARFASMAART